MKFIASCIRRVGELALMYCLWTGGAAAQSCTFSIPNMDWGDIDLGLNVNFDNFLLMSATCTGTPNTTVRFCTNFGAGSGGVNSNGLIRYMKSGGDQLQYNLYKSSAVSGVWGSRYWGLPPTARDWSVALGASGSRTINLTFTGRIFSGQTSVPPGSYSSSFDGIEAQVDYGYNTVLSNCTTSTPTYSVSVPFSVSARYMVSCTVSATTLDFGTQGVLDSDVDSTSAVTVTCTNGASYSVGLNEGTTSGGTTTTRKMVGQTSSATINYQMFQDAARTDNWGNASGS